MPAGLAAAAIGAGMGLISGEWNASRGYHYNKKAQKLQIKGMKEMADYSNQKQMELWEATNYPAQMEMLKKAGLSPGLIYGMGGAGGATTGSGASSNVGANTGYQGGDWSMGLQLGLLQANKNLIEAQTQKTKAEATKIAGVDTEEAKSRIDNLMQGLDNLREDWNVKRLQQAKMQMDNWEQQASQEARMNTIESNAHIMAQQLEILRNEGKISDETLNDKIKTIKLEAIAAGLKNALISAQTGKTKSDIEVNNKQMNLWIQQNMMNWDKMSQENRKIAIQELLMQHNTDLTVEGMRNLSGLIDNIFFIAPKATQGRTVIEGFKKY